MKKLFLFLIAYLFLISPSSVFAEVVFSQIPPNEVYSGAILNTPNFVSFTCTAGLNCGVSGQTIYNVGVWIKKVGNPENIRLQIVDSWNTSVITDSSIFSNSIPASSVSDKYYTLKWFYFPQGVVIGNRFEQNQHFQFKYEQASTTFNTTNYYRVLQHDTSDMQAPQQWCKTGWGCASSLFFWKMDNSPNDLSQVIIPEEPPLTFTGNIFSQTDDSEVYTTTNRELNVIQSIGKGKIGTITKLKIKIGQNSPYEWNGSYAVILYDMGTNNIQVGSKYCQLKKVWTDFTSKGLAERDIVFDNNTVTCAGGMTLTLDPTHYYSFQINITFWFWGFNSATYYIAGSSTETPDAPLYTYNTLQHPGNMRTIFMQVDGIGVPPPTPVGYSSVLFLPGLEASRLYKDRGVTCSINCEDQLWEPNVSSDVDDLFLDQSGVSLTSGIYTRDVIDKSIIFNIYKSLIQKLDQLVATTSPNKVKEWKAYAYDWRKGVDDIVQNGTEYEDEQIVSLIDTLQNLASSSNTGKVTIVTHSNGGLLAKFLIKKLSEMKSLGQNNLIDKIDNLILIASPQIGTPEGLFALLHGYDQKLPGKLMSESKARQLAQNMPSAYGLLPSSKYFEQAGIIHPVVFIAGANEQYINTYGVDIDTHNEQNDFILGSEGRSTPAIDDLISPIIGDSLLLEKSESLHNTIDNMVIPPSIKVIEIAGWGKATIAGMKYTGNDLEPVYTYNGDKTVVGQSALYGQGEKYWLDLSRSKLEHKNITEDSDLLFFIQSIIENTSVSTNIKNTEPIQGTSKLHLSVHSPITIGVTDLLGNFTGKICDVNGDCYVQEDIPGSTYNEFGGGKYVTLAEGDLQKVSMQGTGVGVFTFKFEKVMLGGVTEEQMFQDIPVTPETKAELVVNELTHTPELFLDVTGDGENDFNIKPDTNFDPILFLQILRKMVSGFDISSAEKNKLYNKIDVIIKAIQTNKISKSKLTIERFKKSLTNNKKSNKLTSTDTQLLIKMLNELLDNLNK